MKRVLYLVGAGVCLVGLLLSGIRQSNAQQTAQPPERFRTISVTTTQYVWQVISNQTGKLMCEVIVDQDREPTPDETLIACGSLFNPIYPTPTSGPTPAATPRPTPTIISGNAFLASVSYQLIDERTFTRLVKVPMQDIIVNLKVPAEPSTEPYVLITAYEPEPEYKITLVTGKINGVSFRCGESPCKVPVGTDAQIEFWAVSSFGDESQHINAIFRMLRQNGQDNLVLQSLSPISTYTDSCANIWGVPNEARPDWAMFVNSPEALNTDRKLFYLGEQMIKSGLVNASDCPSGGLLSNGSPNACGMQRAAPEMTRWQNQYDVPIWSTARDLGVPPKLIKSVMGIESQFWPANMVYYVNEYGLAQINQYGADVALRWDSELFAQVCNGLLFDCSRSYASLPTWLQATMRGGLVRSINADCGNCQYGIDFAQAVHSVPTITRVLRANCYQVDHILDENRVTARYEDLWRFTMTSYHSGYDCLNTAIRNTRKAEQSINWTNVAPRLDDACLGGSDYVNDLWEQLQTFDTYLLQASPPEAVNAVILPTAIPSPSPTPQLSRSVVRVTVYVDANQNSRIDPGEGVNDLDVLVEVSDGTSFTKEVVDGVALFDMTGKPLGASIAVSLPALFRSEQVLLPARGDVPVTFRLEGPVVPPVLP